MHDPFHPPRTRRRFLRTGLHGIIATAMAPQLLTTHVRGAPPPSQRLTLGFIGVGDHGVNVNLKSLLQETDCVALAVCDAFASRANAARELVNAHYGNQDCRSYRDFRELLARSDIDAVVISSPDHWHVPMALLALAAGKHVLCEKPTLTIAEGRSLADAVRRSGKVFATALEDRSVIHYHKIAEVVRNGGIGRLHRILVGLPIGAITPHEAPAPVPDDLDFNLWLGPAAERPFSPKLTERSTWRQIRDFSGGTLTDWGAHLIDTAQVGNFSENSGPVSVEGTGDVPQDALNSVPRNYDLTYAYANGVTMHVKSDVPSIRFEGTDGWVGNRGWRGQLQASDLDLYRRTYEPHANKIWPRPATEHRDFLDAVRDARPPIYTAEALHRLSTVMHIGNISLEVGRRLRWDPSLESFVGDDAANALRSRPARDWQRA